MRTRNSNFPNNSNVTIPRRRNRGRAPNIVEPELRTIVEVAPMAERTMEELLRAPTEGYGEAIVLPEINADHFEIKTNLLQLVQASPFHGYERENPHAHINSFKRITSTLRFRDVPNDVIKLMMFPYSLEGAAKVWMNTTSRESVSKTDERIDKLADQISTLVEIVSKKVVTPAPVKAVEEFSFYLYGLMLGTNALTPTQIPITINLVFVRQQGFHLPTNFVIVDFEADPRVPLILGRSFLRTGRALIDVYEGELILRDGDERLIFHVNKHPQKHANESIKMINFIDVSCEDSVGEVLRLKKSNHFLSGSTTPLSDSFPSLTSFETSDSLLEEFADELALLDPFPPGNEDVDVEAKLREIELLLNPCLPPPGDDESFLKDDVQKENFQVYSNPLFEFDVNYNSSNINPLFKEMLEDVESKDSNVSNFDEPVLLNTPLFDEDECFDPGGNIDEIDAFLAIEVSTNIEEGYYDSEGDVFYLESLLSDDTTHNLSPEVFFDHEPQCFKDESELDTLENMVKVFDPGIWEKTFSPSCVRLSSKDHHYLFFTIVVQILFTHHVNFLFSFGSEDTIFDPGIFAFHFSSQEPVAVKCSMEFCFSTCFIPKDE
ncbi:reverse transcriptase domain-containing protein [Tanacetum coccineum]|uniref:Reverse transcriptase domain-containing protein n=1 Tax=Tanacetum coccineum TaxID=301880 RepID=A0ABQ5AZN2_9ASTR